MKKSVLCIALTVSLLLAGCKGQQAKDPNPTGTAINYNDYVFFSGEYACTAQGVYFLKDSTLYFMDKNHNYIPLCSNPQCTHRSSDCSAYLGAPSIYAVNDHLYYMANSADGQEQLFQMSLTGTERQAVNDIAVLKDCLTFSISYLVAGEHFVLRATVPTAESSDTTVYSASLERNAPLTPIFTDLEQDLIVADLMNATDEWVFAIAEDSDGSCYMVGYEFAAGKSHKLFQLDPMYTSKVSVLPDGTFVWSVLNEGIYQMRPGETPTLLCTLQDWAQGVAIPDGQYFYLSNMAAAQISNTIPAEQTGVFIYSLAGEPVGFLPAKDIAGALSYAFSTEQYVYFYDFNAMNAVPVCYLDKSEIGTDALCWHTIG